MLTAHVLSAQGSGWGWLGYSKDSGKLVLETTANQDPLSTKARSVGAPRCVRSCERGACTLRALGQSRAPQSLAN